MDKSGEKQKWATAWACAHRATSFTRWNQRSFRYTIKNNFYGNAVRCSFSNWYGLNDCLIESVWIETGRNKMPLLCNGETSFVIRGGEYRKYTDLCECPISPGEVTIEVCFSKCDRPESGQTFKYGSSGVVMILQSLEVRTESHVKVMTVFGDSIAHWGFWTESFKEAIYEKYYGEASFFEMGIDGNRLLNSSPSHALDTWGYSGIDRLRHDLLDICGLTDCFFALGRNDLALPTEDKDELLTFEKYTVIVENMILELHKKSVRVIGLTMLPIQNDEIFDEKRSRVRKKINEWILKDALFDQVIDVNEKLGNAADDSIIQQYVWQDGFHINQQGGKVMKEQIERNYSRGYVKE